MSPTLNHFGSAAKGQVPTAGTISEAVVMGKKTGAYDLLAAEIGHELNAGRIDLSAIGMKTKAAHIEIVEPPAFMQRDSNKTYTQAYKYDALKNEDIGSARVSDPKLPAPSGP